MKKNIIVYIVIGLMCALLTYGIAMRIRAENSSGTTLSESIRENEIKTEILKLKEKYDKLYKTVEKTEKSLEKERENAANNNGELVSLERQIANTNILLGTTEARGSGIKITINEIAIVQTKNTQMKNDLINIINELYNAGAEAISINGQRIVNITGIEFDDNILKINGTKIISPYEIKAIGSQDTLSMLARPGGYLEIMELRGLTSKLSKENNIVIPKYTGTYNFEYLEKGAE
ncbi:MAG: DUF881 domain-containing protein [Clostridia bacterium]|nr:DUF881 domain-containing protein [Clostridia bacterium]